MQPVDLINLSTPSSHVGMFIVVRLIHIHKHPVEIYDWFHGMSFLRCWKWVHERLYMDVNMMINRVWYGCWYCWCYMGKGRGLTIHLGMRPLVVVTGLAQWQSPDSHPWSCMPYIAFLQICMNVKWAHGCECVSIQGKEIGIRLGSHRFFKRMNRLKLIQASSSLTMPTRSS